MLPLSIASRFLTSSRGQTILIVLGIAIGVSVQVYVGSLIGSPPTDTPIGRPSTSAIGSVMSG